VPRALPCVRIPVVLPLSLLLLPADRAFLERWRWVVVQWRVVQWPVVRRREVSAASWRGAVSYTAAEWRTIEPLARQAEEQAREHPERRDLFLCHAWDDREGAAKELCDLLVSLGATVWFSEKDVGLGKSLLREIDKGLAISRIGIVLVTPALLKRLEAEGSPTRNSPRCSRPTGSSPSPMARPSTPSETSAPCSPHGPV
jgi:hypothetical protein